jgi:hypothetical protein
LKQSSAACGTPALKKTLNYELLSIPESLRATGMELDE